MCKSNDGRNFIIITKSPKSLKVVGRRAKYCILLSIDNRFHSISVDLFDVKFFLNAIVFIRHGLSF